MKIHFIRHPETLWNRKGLFQGIKEGGPSQLGRLATRNFVEKSKKDKIDLIYYAANKRCKYLADELLKVHKEIRAKKEDARLNERSFGEYEGFPESNVAKVTPYDSKDFKRKFVWRPPGGESLEDILPRVKKFLSDIKKVDKNSKVIYVITSGGVIRVAMILLGLKTLREAMMHKAKNLEAIKANLR